MGIRSHEQYALLTDYDPGSAYSEAYKTIYANIRFHWNDAVLAPHSLLLTTPSPSVDQGGVAANIAIVAAQSGVPTILVDANLHNPSLQQRFGLSKGPGLSDLLASEEQEVTPEDAGASLAETFVPRLRLLGAGTKTAQGSTLLLSAKLQVVVQSLCRPESVAHLVIFHSPPVLVGADASVVSALVEATFLTIVTERTTRSQAKQAQEQLQRAHARLAGVILLNMPPRSRS